MGSMSYYEVHYIVEASTIITISIMLMAMVDSVYKFTFIDVGCNGGVFGQCRLSNFLKPAAEHLREGGGRPVLFVVVADDAFPLRHNLMKP